MAFDRNINIANEDHSMYFDELLALGRKSNQDAKLQELLDSVNPDDMLTLIYTSGTTGKPQRSYPYSSFFYDWYLSVSTEIFPM